MHPVLCNIAVIIIHISTYINPLGAKNDNSRLKCCILPDQITVIENEISIQTYFLNVCSQIEMSNFHPLEVVGRGSDAQLQVGGNLY